MAKSKKSLPTSKSTQSPQVGPTANAKQLVYWIIIGTIIAEALSFVATSYLTSGIWEVLNLYIPAVAAALIGGIFIGAMAKEKKIAVLSGLAVGVIYAVVNLVQLFYVATSPDLLPPISLIIYTMFFWIVSGGVGGAIGTLFTKGK